MTGRVITGLAVLAILASTQAKTPRQENDGPATVDPPAQSRATCSVRIEIVDAATGEPLSGVVRVRDEGGAPVAIAELLPRGLGVPEDLSIHDWHLLPAATTVALPRKVLNLRAFHGLETEFADATIDLRDKTEAKARLPLRRFDDTHARGLQSANTHVHLQKVARGESERYLLEVACCERLDVIYISYLERAEADLEYTSNKYTRGDLERLTRKSRAPQGHQLGVPHDHAHPHPHAHLHGTEFDNGQEHRHNFEGFNEGYGHVMLLHLQELVQPVSIGPGIMKRGTDFPSLARGIERARDQGGTIIWCHNEWGLEDIPNWLAGKLHANNIFDGGTHGSYWHSFYRYLNAGLKVPFSTGTDWFIYDLSRVYVVADPGLVGGDRYLSSEQWLAHLAAGRSFITNGPLLEFTVDGRRLGDTLDLPRTGAVKIFGRAEGRNDFERIELVRNGEVVSTAPGRPRDGHFEAELELQLPVDQPCWLALRTPPPSAPKHAEFQRPTSLNEFGRELFAHTSAIYVTLAGQSVFDPAAAESLLAEMRASRDLVLKHSLFANDDERDSVLHVYDAGIADMERRLEERR
jgi:hypothetical protein